MKLEVMGAGCVCADGDANDYIAISDENDNTILSLWGSNDKENRKLAHLFAAAPELYAALKAALPELAMAATQEARSNLAPTGLQKRRVKQDLYNAALAALAKVEGKE